MRKKRSRAPLHGFFILKQKQKEAIQFIKENCPPEGYFLGFSGGKDSLVLKHLNELSKVKFKSYYSSTGIDPPELVSYIKKNHPEVIFLKPKTSFYKAIVKKGFPTKFTRWCCDYLKKNPSKTIPLKHRLMGIRAEESAKRAARGKVSKIGSQFIYKPLFDWTEYEIWEYIDSYKLKYCKLYDEGFHRLGCVVCPFLCYKNSKPLLHHKQRWPGIYKAFETAMEELYEDREWYRQRAKGYAYLFEDFLKNWYEGK